MSKIHHYIKLIKESVSLDDLDDSDLMDIFFATFRTWLKEKKPNVNQKLAISFLIRRYSKEFLNDLGVLEPDDDDYEPGYLDRWGIRNYTRKMIEKGVAEMPEFDTPEQTFLQTYGKNLDFILSRVPLPSYAEYEVSEDEPYFLTLNIMVNFPEMLKSSETLRPISAYRNDIENYLKNYLGVEFGEPKYGQLDLDLKDYTFEGFDQWKKTDAKKIRESLKLLDTHHILHSLVVKPGRKLNIQIKFKDNYQGNIYSNRRELKSSLKSVLEQMGYQHFTID